MNELLKEYESERVSGSQLLSDIQTFFMDILFLFFWIKFVVFLG